MIWHILTMRCPGYPGTPVVPVDEVAFRSDQMVRMEGTCPSCSRRLFLEESFEEATPKDKQDDPAPFDLLAWRPHGKPS